MYIDSYAKDWLDHLTEQQANLPNGAALLLLLDGAFVPGLFRHLTASSRPILLFEALPGCTEETRDVSPFVVPFDPSSQVLRRVLSKCSGWPMVSAIVTYESAEQLSARLAAWCVVEADGHRFNFRFPDTRRLPAIFETLTLQQRLEFGGSAISWDFIARDGQWQQLPIQPTAHAADISSQPQLDEQQFARLVMDSEEDEVWTRLLDRGVQAAFLPSESHRLLSNALRIANGARLDMSMKLRWCADCFANWASGNPEGLEARFTQWLEEETRDDDKAISHAI